MPNYFDRRSATQFYKCVNTYYCHFNAPCGGGGPGGFMQAGPLCIGDFEPNSFPHPNSVAARYLMPEDIKKIADFVFSIATVLNWDDVKADFERWEGKYPHMYLDTKGLVTVGIGKMLPNIAAAQKLGFVRQSDAVAATAAEIEIDFKEVSKQTKGKLAASYKKDTKLDLPDNVIYELLKTEVSEFEKKLEDNFEGYKAYPNTAKRALLDMIYNLGLAGLLKFKKLKKAVESGNWMEAAKECHRNGLSEERNNWTRDMFLKTAQ
jgi:GH24 family phage-related lysozyme (muramidase)